MKKDAPKRKQAGRLAKPLGVAAAAVAALGVGAYFLLGPSAPSEDQSRENVVQVGNIVRAHIQAHKVPPRTLMELAGTAASRGEKLPTMVPAGARPVPYAVVYTIAPDHWLLSATAGDGKPLQFHGRPLQQQVQ